MNRRDYEYPSKMFCYIINNNLNLMRYLDGGFIFCAFLLGSIDPKQKV
jgi:hypothetical protein